MSKKRIAFLIPTLAAGGAERVAVLLCNAWAQSGHQVDLITYQAHDAPCAYSIADGVTLHALDLLSEHTGLLSRLKNNLNRLRSLTRLLRALKPDCLIAFLTEANVQAVLAGKLTNVPVLISERTHPGHHVVPGFHKAMRAMTYRYASRLVVQSEEVSSWYARHMGLTNLVTIENPIDLIRFHPPDGPIEDRPKRIIGIGRMDPGKAFDVLISAFERIADRHPTWQLTILGDGPMRDELEAMRVSSKLMDRVDFPGISDRVPEALRASSIFVSTSRYEGFPNAVMEALACGCCVIAADAPGALSLLLGGGRNGVLVPVGDVAALSSSLDRMMSAPEAREAFANRGSTAMQHYALPVIAERWITLVSTVLTTKQRPRSAS